MSPEQRRQLVMMHEGQVLNFCSQNDGSGDFARCVIDGAMNALMRIEGSANAAQYSFALSDRVVGALREPTKLPTPDPPTPLPVLTGPPRPVTLYPAYAGWLFGVLCGLAIAGAFR